jgi:hypothetical protein
VAELGRLIPERWLWNVTQQDDHSFIVPFPSRGDLQRSVAFGKAETKEHGVSLLFQEWKPRKRDCHYKESGLGYSGCQKKLREFSVLWALGSMLGATQSVDMISSLKQDYGSVEVAVLNVDLLPNSIDTAVIGDRLFTLPIQVEGLEVNNLHGNQMDLDEGNAGGDRSMEERNASQGNVNPSQGKGNKPNSGGPSQQDGAPSRDKRVVDMGVVVQHGEGIHASVLAQEEINSNLNAGNSVNLNQQINTVNASISVQHNHQILSRADQENNEAFNMIVTSPSRGATLDIEGMELGSFSPDVNKSGIGLHPEFSGTYQPSIG